VDEILTGTVISEDTGSIVYGVYPTDDCSQREGDKICNLVLPDHLLNTWKLYNYEGDIIMLDFSAMWCSPCREAAKISQSLQDEYGSYGVQIVTVLLADTGNNDPDAVDAQAWIDQYSITTATVLLGSADLIGDPDEGGYPISAYPTFVFIDRDLIIYDGIYGYSETYIKERLEEMIATN
jgi:thiol-disulfide isomerase/thioredoxin